MKLELIPDTDSRLHTSVPDFDFANPDMDPKELVKKLSDFMDARQAVGLAANQVGLQYRVFVMKTHGFGRLAAFNPRIVTPSSLKKNFVEKCLTFGPMKRSIDRPASIGLHFTDLNGVERTRNLGGLAAVVVQHETDHLDGLLFTRLGTPVR